MKGKILIFLSILIVSNSLAQENVNEDLLVALNNKAGYKNLSLVNGVEYIELYRSINTEHQFFNGRDFYKGTLEYQGQFYKDIQLKYDLFRDILVAKLQRGVEGTLILELIKDHVRRFTIGEKNFINVQDPNLEITLGFYEIILVEDNLKILKKHRLNAIEKQDRSMAYYEFEKLDSQFYFVLDNSKYIEADKSDLLDFLPDCKEIILEQFKGKRSFLRQEPDLFWKELGKSINLSPCLKN